MWVKMTLSFLFFSIFFTLRGVHKCRASPRLKPHLMEGAIIHPAAGGAACRRRVPEATQTRNVLGWLFGPVPLPPAGHWCLKQEERNRKPVPKHETSILKFFYLLLKWSAHPAMLNSCFEGFPKPRWSSELSLLLPKNCGTFCCCTLSRPPQCPILYCPFFLVLNPLLCNFYVQHFVLV